jgi:hypothetical protein
MADDSTITSIIAIVVSLGGIVLGIVNHKRIRSNCCGKELMASIDVETTTPPNKLQIKVPAETST